MTHNHSKATFSMTIKEIGAHLRIGGPDGEGYLIKSRRFNSTHSLTSI